MKISALLLLAGFALAGFSLNELAVAQNAAVAQDAAAPAQADSAAKNTTKTTAPPPEVKLIAIPAGSKIPLELKQAISTKTAREGDPVYAKTAFPFLVNERVIVPAGTYVQGKIARTQRGGHLKGRAELLVHFTSMIYPSGYTVLLGGNIENAPGAEHSSMKDQEGTIQQDSDAGRKAKEAAAGATTGAVTGAIINGGKGAAIGAGVGGVAGIAIALLSRGADVRLEPGTSLEMEIQREIAVDPSRIGSGSSSAKAD